MPYLTALVHKDNDGSEVFMKIRARRIPVRKGAHWSSSASRTVRAYVSKPIPFLSNPNIPAREVEYTHFGTVRWRLEGVRKPPVNKSNPGKLTGWIFWDGMFYSWIKFPEVIDLKNKLDIHCWSSTASKAWALKRAAKMWKTIELEHASTAKKMRIDDDTIGWWGPIRMGGA